MDSCDLKQKLNWLSDETLFSLCSRIHFFNGTDKCSDTSSSLFGASRGGSSHDFPNCLDAFIEKSGSYWGDAESVISQHTIAPLFAPFQSYENSQFLLKAMRGDGLGGIKYRLGLHTSRFGAYHPLKACPECIEADVLDVGVAYWHLTHQYPGVHICPTHGRLLGEYIYKRTWAGRFSWVLPRLEQLVLPDDAAIASKDIDAFLALAHNSIQLSELGFRLNFMPYLVAHTYRQEIELSGKSTPNLHAVKDFLEFAKPLRSLQPFQSLPSTNESASSFLSNLLRTPRGHVHPLKHLTLITWHFGNLDRFLSGYDQAQRSDGASVLDIDSGIEPPPKSVVPESTTARNATFSQQALRPKVLKAGVRGELIALLQRGTPKAELCIQFGITVSTINKLLRANPVLHSAWQLAHHQELLRHHRSCWLSTCATSPGMSPKNLRQQSPSTYAWLYRNDKAWLLAQTAGLPSGRIGNNSRIDWIARDNALELLVRERLREVFDRVEGLELTRMQLFTLVPSLPTALQRSGRYSGTRELLSTVLGRRRLN